MGPVRLNGRQGDTVLMNFKRALAAPSAVFLVALLPLSAGADVKAGDVITRANLEKAGDLLSPGMQWIVERGARLTIIDPTPVSASRIYMEATEKYAAQVKLSDDGQALLNWVAGRPFTTIDANDPEVARKIMYNYEKRWSQTDDVMLRNFDADTGALGVEGRGMTVERHFLLDTFRRLYYKGRLEVDPKPDWLPNEDEALFKQSMHPFIEPFDLRGVGATFYRYQDHTRQDDTWLYLPQLRRVRRLSSAQRSDALFGQDTDQDSYYGYSGNIAWADWKYLGEKTLLGAMHAENYPVKWGEGSADFFFDDVWEKREVYVVEFKSKLPQYAYGKRMLFVDKECFLIPYTDIYDQADQLWKVWVNLFKIARQPFPNPPEGGTYEDEVAFIPAIVMVDEQLVHATRASLPSHRFEREVGWFLNQDNATVDFFSVAELISSGR